MVLLRIYHYKFTKIIWINCFILLSGNISNHRFISNKLKKILKFAIKFKFTQMNKKNAHYLCMILFSSTSFSLQLIAIFTDIFLVWKKILIVLLIFVKVQFVILDTESSSIILKMNSNIHLYEFKFYCKF